MEGKINRGIYHNAIVDMDGDLEIAGGNWWVPKIHTNGHKLTISHPVWHATIDGSKRREDWGDNVITLFPLTPAMLDPEGTLKELGAYELGETMYRAVKKRGNDARDAYLRIISILRAPGGDALTLSEFVDTYTTELADNGTYSMWIVKKMVLHAKGAEWMASKTNAEMFAALQTFICKPENTADRLTGGLTEIIGEVA